MRLRDIDSVSTGHVVTVDWDPRRNRLDKFLVITVRSFNSISTRSKRGTGITWPGLGSASSSMIPIPTMMMVVVMAHTWRHKSAVHVLATIIITRCLDLLIRPTDPTIIISALDVLVFAAAIDWMVILLRGRRQRGLIRKILKLMKIPVVGVTVYP